MGSNIFVLSAFSVFCFFACRAAPLPLPPPEKTIEAVESDERMKGKTALVVTADHGGVDTGHGNTSEPRNYTIPFIVTGPGIAEGVDLYDVTSGTRQRPGTGNPPYGAKITPIRNGDAGNLALSLLGFSPIPGSLMFDMMR